MYRDGSHLNLAVLFIKSNYIHLVTKKRDEKGFVSDTNNVHVEYFYDCKVIYCKVT